jgi:hypothetical protein
VADDRGWLQLFNALCEANPKRFQQPKVHPWRSSFADLEDLAISGEPFEEEDVHRTIEILKNNPQRPVFAYMWQFDDDSFTGSIQIA